MTEECDRHHKEKMLVVTGRQLTRRLRCFLLVWQFVLVMRHPCRRQFRKKQTAVYGTQKLIGEEMHLSLRLVVFNGDLFRNLTVVSSRMELNFEPNSSVLSCARVRGEKKQTEKRREAMKARENSVWKGHGWSYWTASGRDFFYYPHFQRSKRGLMFYKLLHYTKL